MQKRRKWCKEVNCEEITRVVDEMKMFLVEKEVTPEEAECIANVLLTKVKKDNKMSKKRFMKEARYM